VDLPLWKIFIFSFAICAKFTLEKGISPNFQPFYFIDLMTENPKFEGKKQKNQKKKKNKKTNKPKIS
jgi:hypothetical protein